MTLTKVRAGDVLAGLGGIALIVLVFAAPWYHFIEGVYPGTRVIAPGHETQTAWEALDVLRFALILTALLGITQFATTVFERTTAWPVAAGVFSAAIGSLTSLWMLIRVINPPGPNAEADLRWGAWAGLLATLAVTAGAWWSMRDEVRP
jgi:hypothetical protein